MAMTRFIDKGKTISRSQLAKIRRAGEERAAERLAQKLGYPYADLSKMPISLDAVRDDTRSRGARREDRGDRGAR